MRKIGLVLSLLYIFLAISSGQAQFCEGALHSNLLPGDTAIVVVEDTLNVRAEASVSGTRITELDPDTEVSIVAGPRCVDGYAWYQGELSDGQLGWMAESDGEDYFLGKLPRQFVTYTTPEDIQPTLKFTYLDGSIDRIVQDMTVAHGLSWSGTSTILYPVDGDPIFINVIAVEDIDADSPIAPLVEDLQNLIALNSDEAFSQIPEFTNNMGESRQLIAQQNFADFQNGRGLRYIAFYSQDDSYTDVERDNFEYTFHGLTDDGQYYVNIAGLGIASPELPPSPPQDPDDMSAYFAGYDDWLIDIETFLNSIAPVSFAPRFSMIEGILNSLDVNDTP